jgi:hypothetical protein
MRISLGCENSSTFDVGASCLQNQACLTRQGVLGLFEFNCVIDENYYV